MASMAREAWTDERLDDLNGKADRLDQRMENGFGECRTEFRVLRAEMREEFKGVREELNDQIGGVRRELGEQIGGVRGEMAELRAEIGSLNRTIHQFLFAIVGTIFLGFMGTISALITLT